MTLRLTVRWAMGLLHSQSRAIAQRCMEETCAYLQQVIDEKTRTPDDRVITAVVSGATENAMPSPSTRIPGKKVPQ